AFQIGPIVIRWYGILMATSIVVGLWIGYRQAKREGLPADDIISVGQWAILAGLVGARPYEVIFNWDYYGPYPGKSVGWWGGAAGERADPPRARRDRAVDGAGAGDRPVGELLQRGSLRPPDRFAVE